jgi:hypothetical protein
MKFLLELGFLFSLRKHDRCLYELSKFTGTVPGEIDGLGAGPNIRADTLATFNWLNIRKRQSGSKLSG